MSIEYLSTHTIADKQLNEIVESLKGDRELSFSGEKDNRYYFNLQGLQVYDRPHFSIGQYEDYLYLCSDLPNRNDEHKIVSKIEEGFSLKMEED